MQEDVNQGDYNGEKLNFLVHDQEELKWIKEIFLPQVESGNFDLVVQPAGLIAVETSDRRIALNAPNQDWDKEFEESVRRITEGSAFAKKVFDQKEAITRIGNQKINDRSHRLFFCSVINRTENCFLLTIVTLPYILSPHKSMLPNRAFFPIYARKNHHPWRARTQPKKHFSGTSAQSNDCVHRFVRIRQIQFGV